MRYALAAAVSLIALFAASADGLASSITKDTTWSGSVTVEGVLTVEKDATLTIQPSTRVLFVPADQDEEGLAGSGMLVYGSIIAKGRQEGRIEFTSASENPHPGDWGEIKIIESPGSEFAGCDFGFGCWGIHVHDSTLKVEDCSFTGNSFGGLRGKGGDVEITDSLFHGMEIGIRYWKGGPAIRGCTITENGTGIFFRKDSEDASVHGNNIYGNREYDLKLGDAQEKDLDVSGNWWGSADESAIRKKIFDKSREDYIGRALIAPVLDSMAGGR